MAQEMAVLAHALIKVITGFVLFFTPVSVCIQAARRRTGALRVV